VFHMLSATVGVGGRGEISRGCGPGSDAGSDRPGRISFRYPGMAKFANHGILRFGPEIEDWIRVARKSCEFEFPGKWKDRQRGKSGHGACCSPSMQRLRPRDDHVERLSPSMAGWREGLLWLFQGGPRRFKGGPRWRDG
jgi:hypothetical protein